MLLIEHDCILVYEWGELFDYVLEIFDATICYYGKCFIRKSAFEPVLWGAPRPPGDTLDLCERCSTSKKKGKTCVGDPRPHRKNRFFSEIEDFPQRSKVSPRGRGSPHTEVEVLTDRLRFSGRGRGSPKEVLPWRLRFSRRGRGSPLGVVVSLRGRGSRTERSRFSLGGRGSPEVSSTVPSVPYSNLLQENLDLKTLRLTPSHRREIDRSTYCSSVTPSNPLWTMSDKELS